MTTLGPYEIVRELGRGGGGRVYLARDPRLGRSVAIKVLHEPDGEILERFRREQKALARLRHPAIVEIFDVGESDGQPYLVMEFVDGESLESALRQGKVPWRLGVERVRQIADAVEFAHSRGVLHRDLKPANVLIGGDGAVKITDFGLAKLRDGDSQRLSVTGTILGTPAYMSPEQARGDWSHVDERTDVWGIGAILYEVLTGRPPFVAGSLTDILEAVEHREPDSPGRANPEVDSRIEAVCLKSLEKPPDRRYASARQLAEDLTRYLAGQPVLARPEKIRRALGRQKRIAMAGVVALVLTAAIGMIVPRVLREREIERNRVEARSAFGAGDWERAAIAAGHVLRVRHDAEMDAIVAETRVRLEERRARRESAELMARILDTRTYYYVADIDIRRKLDEVERSLRELQSRAGSDPGTALAIGMGWYFLGEDERAEEALLRVDGKEPAAAYYLARVYLDRALATLVLPRDEIFWEKAVEADVWSRKAVERLQSAGGVDALDLHVAGAYLAVTEGRHEDAVRICAEGRSRFGDRPGTEDYDFLEAVTLASGAKAKCELALARRPHFPSALYLRACLRFREGHEEGTLSDLSAALAIQPGMSEAYYFRAGLRACRGEWDAALDDARESVRRRPKNPTYSYRLAALLRRRGDRAGSVATMDNYVRANPDNPWGRVYRGIMKTGVGGNLDGAIEDFTAAIRIQRTACSAWANRGMAWWEKSDLAAAMRDFESLFEIHPGCVEAFLGRGMVRTQSGEHRKAVEDFTEAIRRDPKRALAYANRSGARIYLLEWDGAEADASEALRLDPRLANAYCNRATARHYKGNLSGMREDVESALRADSTYYMPWLMRGWDRAEQEDWGNAIRDFDESIRLEPRPQSFLSRGDAHRSLGNRRKAEEDFTSALRLDPNWLLAYNRRVQVRIELEDLDGAIADCTEMIRIDPLCYPALANRGSAWTRKGNRTRAIEDYEAALRIAPAQWKGRREVERILEDLRR